MALCIISESELVLADSNYSATWEYDENLGRLYSLLHQFGLDISKTYERQDGLWHRNKMNQIVLCSRYVGQERQDTEWITSGYASQAAKDKYSCSKLLEDIYRAKRLTEDTQAALEARDRYRVLDETYN